MSYSVGGGLKQKFEVYDAHLPSLKRKRKKNGTRIPFVIKKESIIWKKKRGTFIVQKKLKGKQK